MSTQIDQLVSMRDRETLYELMTEDEDWLTQLEAAEGLVKLGDRRGYEFLMTTTMSDDEEILEVAQEIMESAAFARMQADLESEQRLRRGELVQAAKRRLQDGGKVFRYKMVYIPSGALMGDDPLSEGFDIPALEQHGLGGWEIVTMIPSRGARKIGTVEGPITGAYFMLKKEVLVSEANELE